MKPAEFKWTLVQITLGQRGHPWPLQEGATTLGRGTENTIQLDHRSVSRRHAEILLKSEELTVRDLESRNGVKVDGVLRRKATLQAGSHIKIGDIELEVVPTVVSSATEPHLRETKRSDEPADLEGNTFDPDSQTPQGAFSKKYRELQALIQACARLAEGIEGTISMQACLRLLLDAFGAAEAQLYASDGSRESFVAKETDKALVKLATYVAEKFQKYPEASLVTGSQIAQIQQGQRNLSQFNYLIGPLHTGQPASGSSPFLLLIRPTEWADFTHVDRGLLQLVCQVWVRGQARAVQVQDLRRENAELKGRAGVPDLLGTSPAMDKLRGQARKVAATRATVLVLGENGSGKEVVAQFIHENSPRKDGPFIKVNIAAIPETMIESELFGHLKGAYTGAHKARRGKFVLADGGTILLDEIGDLPLALQSKLLRTIEVGEVQPLGAEDVIRVDARIIAATNCDLNQMVREKRFRQDLYHRLDTLRVRVPPLRERLDDVELLATHFLAIFCAQNGLPEMRFAPEAIVDLQRHDWPGNVRELYAVVQRCAASTTPPVINLNAVKEALAERSD